MIIAGDIVPSFKNVEYFEKGQINSILDDNCYQLLLGADYRIYNLETPITNVRTPIKKDGANFCVTPKAIDGMSKLKPSLVSLANNHCKDFGEQGLLDTIDILTSHDIETVGYGTSHEDSKNIHTFERDGIRISVVACAETEFTIFGNGELGAVPYHDYWTNKKIELAKSHSDIVIVLYHGGKEYFQYPSPKLQERCRLMAKNGADYIFCQHSHCIGCYEKYGESTIIYGQGNFIFHQRNERSITKEGLLVELEIKEDKRTINYIPVILNEKDQVCLALGQNREQILTEFMERSDVIINQDVVEQLYNSFAKDNEGAYINKLLGDQKILKLLVRVMRKCKIEPFTEGGYVRLLNLVQNEAHRELLLEILKQKNHKK